MMTKIKFEKSLCENCGQPLFLSKEECRNFIGNKLKQGYIVCSCCGGKQTIEPKRKSENIREKDDKT